MSSDTDSDELEKFVKEQKRHVRKRYMTQRELDRLDTMDDFIADSESDDDVSSEESEKSVLSDSEGVKLVESSDEKYTKSDEKLKNDKSSSLFSDLSDSDSDERVDISESSKAGRRKRLIRYDSDCSADISKEKKKCFNNFAYRCSKEIKRKQTKNRFIFMDSDNYFKIKPSNQFESEISSKKITNTFIQKQSQMSTSSIIIVNNIHDQEVYNNENDNSDHYRNSLIKPTFKYYARTTHILKNYMDFPKLDFISSLFNIVGDNLRDFEVANYLKDFMRNKEYISFKIYRICNETIFSNKLPPETEIKWISRLRETAGRCILSRDKQNPLVHSMTIHLSPKVLTDGERLLKTLVHEMCHGAAWVINNINDGHGHLWRAWTREVERVYPHLSVASPYHSYEIEHTSNEYMDSCQEEDDGKEPSTQSHGIIEKKVTGKHDQELLSGVVQCVEGNWANFQNVNTLD